MIDEGIRIPMDTLRRDPSFCPSEEVLRLEKVYVSWFDKAEFTASITPGSKESFYDAFLCEQNSAVTQHLAFRTDGPVASPSAQEVLVVIMARKLNLRKSLRIMTTPLSCRNLSERGARK